MSDFLKLPVHEFELPLQNPVLVFSVILFIILLSPILLRRLNIPGIIGLIISGVIIGPHGFNVLEKTTAIDLFSTIGLLYIMFIAGLELDMSEFKAHRNKSSLFGFFTFIIPLAIGFPVMYYWLGYDFNASFLTASMFATHTLVAYPIVSKLGVAKNQAVAVAVGGTILTDTAVLIILAVILGNSQGNLTSDFWLQLGVSLALFSAIMFLVIPRVAKWFFSRLESEKHSHYIFVLSVVFFAAFLAELAGVEAIIGAFVAGLALNKVIPHASVLMNRIEFIGSSLFIPFFLISVGMLVDLKIVFSGSQALIIAATLTSVALIGKWLAAFFTQITFGFSRLQRQLIFGLSSSHAAATLAIILVGFKAGILDENILNGTIVLILVTCVIASFATEKAAKGILVAEDKDASIEQKSLAKSHEHFLVPIANMSKMERLLEFAFYIKDKKSLNPISILSVVGNDEEAENNILKAKKKLGEIARHAAAADVNFNLITTIDFNSVGGISRVSREIMADTILLGWPQKAGLLDKLIGEKVDNIVSGTDKTTFICHMQKALILNTRIVTVAPPFAELENGFEGWFFKIAKLSKELSVPFVLHSNAATAHAAADLLKKMKLSIKFNHQDFGDWENYESLHSSVLPNDLLVLVNARKDAVSYMPVLANISSKMATHFTQNSILAIFPQQFSSQHLISQRYQDFTGDPLTKGLKTMQKVRKSIGHLFSNEEDNQSN